MTEAKQLDLFDSVPASRRNDPYSSLAAEEELSGNVGSIRLKVLHALHSYPGCTARELASAGGLDPETTHKRLSELLRLGYARREEAKDKIRTCSISGRHCCLWWAK